MYSIHRFFFFKLKHALFGVRHELTILYDCHMDLL